MPINDFVQMGCSNELGDDHEQIVDEFCGQHKTGKVFMKQATIGNKTKKNRKIINYCKYI